MPEFDDLNTTLAALKSQLEKATSVTELVTRLEATTTALGKRAASIDKSLGTSESRIANIEQAIAQSQKSLADTAAQTIAQWQEATEAVLKASGQNYVATVTTAIEGAGAKFASTVEKLRAEASNRERILARARKWNWGLAITVILLLAIIGFTTGAIPALLRQLN